MRLRILAIFSLAVILSACASNAPKAPATAKKSETPQDATYRIGVEDRVQVAVWRNPELSVEVPVRPDGKISVPLAGDIQASGQTPMELAAAVKNKLSQYLREPHVSVIVTEMQSHEYLSRVRVTGAVRTPTSVPYRPGMTVLDAVLEAGGVNEFAAPNRTKVHRRAKGDSQVIPVALGRILHDGGMDTNIEVRPGDVVAVPERLF